MCVANILYGCTDHYDFGEFGMADQGFKLKGDLMILFDVNTPFLCE